MVFVDSEEPPPKPRNPDEPEKPQTTNKIDEALRKADAELQQADEEAKKKKRKEAEEKEAKSPPKDVTPGSEDDDKKKEEPEKEKVQVSPHLVGVPSSGWILDVLLLTQVFHISRARFPVAESP